MSGELAQGQRLPPVKKLAGLYDVSTATMHAALTSLASLGLVRMAHGVGTFVDRPRDRAALLNHAWLNATTTELLMMRGSLDEDLAVAAARTVATSTRDRAARPLTLITLLARDREALRHAWPEQFLDADSAFHQMIAASVPGAGITAQLRERIDRRLRPRLMAVADSLAQDRQLDRGHHRLAVAILAGDALGAGRLARAIGRREAASLKTALG